MPQIVHHLALARDHSADHAERLGQRADLHVDLAVQVEMVHDAATALAQNTFAVGVIDHGHQVKFFCHIHEFIEGGVIAIHRENAICSNYLETAASFVCFF